MRHMKTITIREPRQAIGRWVRQAQAGDVFVTERRRPAAIPCQARGATG